MVESITKTVIVPREFHGQRIDSVLAQLIPEFSRSQLTNWIKEGCITCNTHLCKPKDKAATDDVLHLQVTFTAVTNDFKSCSPEPIPLNIIFEDDTILVINKPAGLVVHPGAGNREHTLVNALLYHEPSLEHLPRAGLIHRLDKDTTGLLVVAKTLTAHTHLIRQMQARTIQRQYIALVQGYVINGSVLETNFGRHPKNRLKMAVLKQGRQAITEYTVSKHYQNFTLLNVKLMTGRTHQIRVHMNHINHPVIGDPLYGKCFRLPDQASEILKNRLMQFKRQALHACSLAFLHPETEEWLTFTAPLPHDFELLLTALDEHIDSHKS